MGNRSEKGEKVVGVRASTPATHGGGRTYRGERSQRKEIGGEGRMTKTKDVQTESRNSEKSGQKMQTL